MSLTTAELEELQSIVLTLSEEFPHNQDLLWDSAIRIQLGGLGPTSGAGGQAAFDAAVADIKTCQDEVQDYQNRSGSPSSGFDVAVLQVIPPTSTFPVGNVGEILYLETAPNSYIATDQIVIDPVGPNSVQMDEVGTTVFRTVPAASGGVEINNLDTGGGFERVLTTSDSQAHNAEFVTMSLSANIPNERVLTGGTGLSLTDGGAGGLATLDVDVPLPTPTVNLSTLRSDGASAWFEETSVIIGSSLLSVLGPGSTGSVTMSHDDSDARFFQFPAAGDMEFDNAGSYSFITDQDVGWRLDDNGNEIMRILPRDGGAFITTRRIQYHNDDNQWTIVGDIQFDQAGAADTVRMASGTPLSLAATAADFLPLRFASGVFPTSNLFDGLYYASTTGREGLGVVVNGLRNNLSFVSPSVLVYEFNTDTNTAITPPNHEWKMNNATPASVTEIAVDDLMQTTGDFGDYWGANLAVGDKIFIKQQGDETKYLVLTVSGALIDGTGFWRIPVTVEDSGVIFDTTEPCSIEFLQGVITGAAVNAGTVDNEAIVWNDGNQEWEGTGAGVTFPAAPGGTGQVVVAGLAASALTSAAFFSTQTTGDRYILGASSADDADQFGIEWALASSDPNERVNFFWATFGGGNVPLSFEGSGEVHIDNDLITFLNGSMYATEKTLPETDITARGQIWVRDDVPNTLMFTDDASNDVTLSIPFTATEDGLAPLSGGGVVNFLRADGTWAVPAGGVSNPMIADLDGDGFNLDDMGVIYLRERAAAEADVTNQGQIWVFQDPFTTSLMYTNDNGNDFELAALNLTDMNTAAILIPSTTFVECLVFQPDIDRDYMINVAFEVNSPAADDMDVEMVIDTNAVFKGVLQYSNQSGSVTGSFALESAVGDVITNIVTVPTEGMTTPDGTYVTIVGCLNMGATSGTHSVRCAKNADTGADGQFEATAALQASTLQVS